jgi:hypothetical protein
VVVVGDVPCGTQEDGGLTIIEHDLLEIGESALAGLCGCWVTFFDVVISFVTYELVEVIKACKLGEDMEVDVFRWVGSGWKS